ncbi:Uncharacterised protein [Mycobacteroides abscessus subsp. abscessus]|nr:Uncharacterised protein [Mycobacteroides abscessus subsp. abscessus]
MAAASDSEWNRTSSDRVSAPVSSAISRSTPPAEMEASWPSSPTSRTLAPLARACAMSASSSSVPALPTSSTMTMVSGPMRRNQSGIAPGRPAAVCTYLARVSAGALRSPANSMAAAAVGARPMTLPPEERHACESAAMAVVFPEPAGASARATPRPPAAISSTSAIWPALRVLPRAADSSSAKSMSSRSTRRPPCWCAAARMRCSAATIFDEVYSCAPWRR